MSALSFKTAKADENTTRVKTFSSIEVKSGDTLWSLASEYFTDEYQSITQFIELIKNCNSLASDTIRAGSYLIIPYYVTVPNN